MIEKQFTQELIPINESEYVVYNYEKKKYLPKIFNTRVMSIQIMEELELYINKKLL